MKHRNARVLLLALTVLAVELLFFYRPFQLPRSILAGLGSQLARFEMIAAGDIVPCSVFLVGCWALWRLGLIMDSPFRWVAPVLALFSVALFASSVANAYLHKLVLSVFSFVLDMQPWSDYLLISVLAAATVFVLVEPHSSAHLSSRDNLIAAVIAILVVVVSGVTAPGALRVFVYPYFLQAWGTAGLLTVAGTPVDASILVARLFWGIGMWFLIVRVVLSVWRSHLAGDVTSRLQQPVQDEDPAPDGGT